MIVFRDHLNCMVVDNVDAETRKRALVLSMAKGSSNIGRAQGVAICKPALPQPEQ
ncbi:hypothetical protein SJ05684_b55620 (plasmid) [Sinorhizobium sojae CCBAU 05684]|uniref:Uncharacterized protein n=1 Tax=Sinorhizobium sojae CCBAU 05684 TaxID=716928 RepID=A0A249PLI5_9HYPH|nr:hypothetical protein SJ05684_b55620 [Sinorhizobium sojae CCBAU 05684]